MKKNKKTKKVIACLLMLVLVTAAVALAEYAMLSRSYEENRKLRISQQWTRGDLGSGGRQRKREPGRDQSAWTAFCERNTAYGCFRESGTASGNEQPWNFMVSGVQ